MNLLNNIVKETGISKIIMDYKEQIEEYEQEFVEDCYRSSYGERKEIVKKVNITMAGGGSHWWNYEIIFDDDEDYEVYVISKDGREERASRIFFEEDEVYGLYEVDEDDDEKIEYFEDSDDYFEISYYHYFE
tara:strand:- start:6995 stop:7390 length:396 start_codon:yes stop_codon:yes gene_type:complete